MIQIDNTLVSLDVLERQFLCDLSHCKGICCVEGDSGAPLLEEEVSGYDFNAKKIVQTSFNITRDLHCFSMSASLSPFGTWKYYSFVIRANASILQDLKYDKKSQTQTNIKWYFGKTGRKGCVRLIKNGGYVGIISPVWFSVFLL